MKKEKLYHFPLIIEFFKTAQIYYFLIEYDRIYFEKEYCSNEKDF